MVLTPNYDVSQLSPKIIITDRTGVEKYRYETTITTASVSPQQDFTLSELKVHTGSNTDYGYAVLKIDDGIHINWPNTYYNTGWWAEPGEVKQNKKYQEKINELDKLFSKANSYHLSSKIIDLKMESMKGLFDGTKKLYLHANSASDMRDAIEFSEKNNIKKIVIIGGEDALAISDILIKKNIPQSDSLS